MFSFTYFAKQGGERALDEFYRMYLLQYLSVRLLSQDIPTDAGILCDKNATLGDMIKETSDTVPPRQSFSDLTTTDALTTVIFVSRQPSSVRMRSESDRLNGSGVRLLLLNTR
jgi:hypothetical protein